MKHHYSRQMQNFGEQHPAFRYWHSLMQRRVRVYDNGGATVDRYEVQILRTEKGRRVRDIYNMSDDPKSPQGFNQYNYTTTSAERGRVMGRRVQVQDLPLEVIEAIEERIG